MDLSEYTLAVFASHGVMDFLKRQVMSIVENKIRHKDYVIADAGLLEEDIDWIEDKLDVTFVDMAYKDSNPIIVQSPQYRELIGQRPEFLQLFGNRLVSLDADTLFISNNFERLDPVADITLLVRDVEAWAHCMSRPEKDYPNLGVVFYHNDCRDFMKAWEYITFNEEPLKQFEQGNFYRAMQTDEFKRLNVQKLPCRLYNCYETNWISPKTSILHLKSHSSMRMKHTGKTT